MRYKFLDFAGWMGFGFDLYCCDVMCLFGCFVVGSCKAFMVCFGGLDVALAIVRCRLFRCCYCGLLLLVFVDGFTGFGFGICGCVFP